MEMQNVSMDFDNYFSREKCLAAPSFETSHNGDNSVLD